MRNHSFWTNSGLLGAGLLISIGSLAADFDELNYGDRPAASQGERLLASNPEEPAPAESAKSAESKSAEPAAGEPTALEKAAEKPVQELMEAAADGVDAANKVIDEAQKKLADELELGDGQRFETTAIGGDNADLDVLTTRVQGVDLHGSLKLREELVLVADELGQGLKLIDSILDGPGLVERPQFWLLNNDTELAAAIKFRQPEISSARLLMAAKARAYIYKQDSFFVYKAGVGRARLLKLLYEEYAQQQLNMMATGGPAARVAWFHSGMATYLAWIVEAELNGTGIEDVRVGMLNTYGPNFNPDSAPALKTLESADSWAKAIRADFRGTYAQAALSYEYFIRRFNLDAGPRVLRSMSTGETFEQAFENATRISLGRFELELRETLYPVVRKLRKADAERRQAEEAAAREAAAKEAEAGKVEAEAKEAEAGKVEAEAADTKKSEAEAEDAPAKTAAPADSESTGAADQPAKPAPDNGQ